MNTMNQLKLDLPIREMKQTLANSNSFSEPPSSSSPSNAFAYSPRNETHRSPSVNRNGAIGNGSSTPPMLQEDVDTHASFSREPRDNERDNQNYSEAEAEADFDEDDDQENYEYNDDDSAKDDEDFINLPKSKKRIGSITPTRNPYETFSPPSASPSTTPQSTPVKNTNNLVQSNQGGQPKGVNKKKRVCEFCGRSDTPMWRRGPQGKGTLCNACGVKWSLKFRKRAGKKGKDGKDLNDLKSSKKASKNITINEDPSPSHYSQQGGYQTPIKQNGQSYHSFLHNTSVASTTNHSPMRSSLSINVEMNHPNSIYNRSPYHHPNINVSTQSPFNPVHNSSYSATPYMISDNLRNSGDSSPPMTPFLGSPMSGSYGMPDFNLGKEPNFAYSPSGHYIQGQSDFNSFGSKREGGDYQDFFDHKRQKRSRQLELSRKWNLENGEDLDSNKLLGHLLSVAKDRLLEEQEMDEIKHELQKYRQEILEFEELRRYQIEDARAQMTEELNSFKKEIVDSLTSHNSSLNTRVSQCVSALRSDSELLRKNLESLRYDLSKSAASGSLNLELVVSKIRQMESQVGTMQPKLESKLEIGKHSASFSNKKMESQIQQSIQDKKPIIASTLDPIKNQSERHFNHLISQFDQMNSIINNNTQSTSTTSLTQDRKQPL